MQINKLILAITLGAVSAVHGAAFPSSSSDRGGAPAAPQRVFPLLQQKAFQALVSHPGVFAGQFDMIGSNPQLQLQLFVETVNRALVNRIEEHPNISLQQFTFSSGDFGGFSPDGTLVAVSVQNVAGNENEFDTRLINIATGAVQWQVAGKFGGFSSDGNLIAVFLPNAVPNGFDTHLINTATGTVIRQIGGLFQGFSPDGSLVAVNVAGNETQTHLIKIATGTVVWQSAGTFGRFSSSGKIFAVKVPDGAEFHTNLIDIETGDVIRQIVGGSLGFSPDGSLVAVIILQGGDGGFETHLVDTATGAVTRQISGLFNEFSPSGESLVVSPHLGGFVTNLINTATGVVIRSIDGAFGAFSPTGSLIAVFVKNAAGDGFETHLVNVTAGAMVRQIPGIFAGFSPDGKLVMTDSGNGLILTTVDFSKDLAKITDSQQQKLLLAAAQAWLDKKAYPVDDSNYSLYRKIIEQIPYLKNPLLFDVVALQDIYEVSRAELDEYAARILYSNDLQLKDLALRAYDAWYDVQKAQDSQKDDNAIFEDFVETFKLRSLAWRVLRQHADALTNNYQADRAARVAQQTPQVPMPSSPHDTMAGTSEPVVGSSQDGVRAPDAPVTMRLFE